MHCNMLTSTIGSVQSRFFQRFSFCVLRSGRLFQHSVIPAALAVFVLCGMPSLAFGQQVTVLVKEVQNLTLKNNGNKTALLKKLDAAQKSIARGHTDAAVEQLQGFIVQVNDFLGSGKIGAQSAASLIAHTQDIIASLTNDINECLVGNGGCSANAACTNTPGSRTCACNTGFSGDGVTCTDINECATNTDNCDANAASCTNTPGSFTCACTSVSPATASTCTDINECATNTDDCDANATCTNTYRAPLTCDVQPGFSGRWRHLHAVGAPTSPAGADTGGCPGKRQRRANAYGYRERRR